MCKDASLTITVEDEWLYSHTNDKAFAIPPSVVDRRRINHYNKKLCSAVEYSSDLSTKREYSVTNDKARTIPPIVIHRNRGANKKVRTNKIIANDVSEARHWGYRFFELFSNFKWA